MKGEDGRIKYRFPRELRVSVLRNAFSRSGVNTPELGSVFIGIRGQSCQTTQNPIQFPWKPQPRETTGTYRFNGKFHAATTVDNDLGRETLLEIYRITVCLDKKNYGIVYILAFKDRKTDEVVWMIDQLNDEMKASESSEWVEEYNTCTLCYPHER